MAIRRRNFDGKVHKILVFYLISEGGLYAYPYSAAGFGFEPQLFWPNPGRWLRPHRSLEMGKHNGKSRKVGLAVGGALVNKARREGRNGGAAAYLYTTDVGSKGNTMQSVIENNDLQEMMSMVSAMLRGARI